MDLNRDELRRELKAVDADNEAAIPKWYDALRRIVHSETDLTTDEKAAILGVPSPGRRQLFKLGGATIMGAAVLAACGGNDKKAATSTTVSGVPSVDSSMDLPLARTAASLEQLAVDTYDTAIKSGLVKTAAIGDTAKLFRDHHKSHLDALNSTIKSAGGAEVTTANKAVYDALVKPALDALKDEPGVVALALQLELAAAQTYAYAGGTLSTPDLRSTIMTIGGIEARHATILTMVAQKKTAFDVFPDKRAFFPGDNPLKTINGAVLAAS
jgi:hypothetical protein